MANINAIFKPNLLTGWILALISGLLVGTSYVPFPAWAVAFCYVPLWFAAARADQQNLSLKQIFFLGWITQFILTLIGFHWIYYTATEFGELPPLLSALALLLFAALMHIYIPLALLFATVMRRKFDLKPMTLVWLICCFHVFLERLWPSIFEWNLGYTLLWMKWPMAQWADVIGFWGLSSLILLFNALVCMVSLSFAPMRSTEAMIPKKWALGSLSVGIIVALILNFTGADRKTPWLNTDSELTFAVIQASISNDQKIASEKGLNYHGYVIDKYYKTADRTLAEYRARTDHKKIDLMIWPETAMPFPLDQHFHQRMNQRSLLGKISDWNVTLITGGYSLDAVKKDFHGQNVVRNSLFFMDAQGLNAPPYFKSHLLVFGEYMPFGEQLPILYKWLPFVGTYERGKGPITSKITTPNGSSVRVGSQICYESLEASFSRQLSKGGSQILVNVTNDSWFGDWAEPFQHMIMTLARGVENRRPLIRSTNTGVSSAITAAGDILFQSPIDEVWGTVQTIPYKQDPPVTFYTKYGPWDLIIWLVFFFLTFLFHRQSNGDQSGKQFTSSQPRDEKS